MNVANQLRKLAWALEAKTQKGPYGVSEVDYTSDGRISEIRLKVENEWMKVDIGPSPVSPKEAMDIVSKLDREYDEKAMDIRELVKEELPKKIEDAIGSIDIPQISKRSLYKLVLESLENKGWTRFYVPSLGDAAPGVRRVLEELAELGWDTGHE